MATEKEFRLVAFIFPEMDGWGMYQKNESDWPILATKEDATHPRYGLSLCEVAAPRGDPNGRMVVEHNCSLPTSGGDQDQWKRISIKLQAAVSKPPLHKEDFTTFGIFGEDKDV